jgi:hypothetical protein
LKARKQELLVNLKRLAFAHTKDLDQVDRVLQYIAKTYFPELIRKISRLEEKALELRSIATADKKLKNKDLLTWNATALPVTLFEELSPDREVSLLTRRLASQHFRKLASLLHPDFHDPKETGLTHEEAREQYMLANFLYSVYDVEGLLLLRTFLDKALEVSTLEQIDFLEKRTFRLIEKKARMKASAPYEVLRLWMIGKKEQAKAEAEVLFLEKIRALTEEIFGNNRAALLEILNNDDAARDDLCEEGRGHADTPVSAPI